MNILYVSCYPDISFKKIIESGRIISQAAQKFNKLLVNGACLNSCDVEVAVIYKENDTIEKIETESYGSQKIKYHYCEIGGNFINRELTKKRFARDIVSKFAHKNPDGFIVIDSLSPLAFDFSRESKKNNITVVMHITDFKDFLLPNPRHFFKKVKREFLIHKYYKQFKFVDIFLLLTEPMRNKIRIGNRKYIIMDGVCDFELLSSDAEKSDIANNKKIFLYSGALSKQFGLQNLVKGFIDAHTQDSELHLYGSGDYVSELKEICSSYPTIKYFGTIPNEEIVSKQCSADFLVNPRPTKDEYTKYSFPSKNIEYMTSGTPIITTKLPCITDNYDPYVYYFEDDTAEGIKRTIEKCCELSDNELRKKGEMAKKYILENKNNKVQFERILALVESRK